MASRSDTETPILERLAAIETAVIDELATVKTDRQVIGERLSGLVERREEVSDVVFERVSADYQDQSDSLEARAVELKQQAREQFAKLETLLQEAEGAVESCRYDKEEIELRHSLGELEEKDFKSRVGTVQKILDEKEAELGEMAKLKERFVLAFDSEEELFSTLPADGSGADAAEGGPPERAAGAADESSIGSTAELPADTDWESSETQIDAPAEADHDEEAGGGDGAAGTEGEAAESGGLDRGVTAELAGPPPSDAPTSISPGLPPISEAQTAILKEDVALPPPIPARLMSEEGEETVLGPVTLIGRTPDNQVQIERPEVSRRHAEIVFTDQGYVLRDLGSENGTFINGERIQERLLADGDLLLVGAQGLVFHCE